MDNGKKSTNKQTNKKEAQTIRTTVVESKSSKLIPDSYSQERRVHGRDWLRDYYMAISSV